MIIEYIGIVNWIKLSQLQSLGMPQELFFVFVIFLGIVGCYFIIRPITLILLSLKSERLVSYLLSALIFIVIFFSVVLLVGKIDVMTYQLLKLSLQALAIFGFGLCVTHLFKQWSRRRKNIKKSHQY